MKDLQNAEMKLSEIQKLSKICSESAFEISKFYPKKYPTERIQICKKKSKKFESNTNVDISDSKISKSKNLILLF